LKNPHKVLFCPTQEGPGLHCAIDEKSTLTMPQASQYTARHSWGRMGLAGLCVAVLTGCADSAYLLQAIQGHLQVMQAAKPVTQWLQDPDTPGALKERLALAQRLRAFSVTELHLPANPSYHRYAELQRRAVVWNVVAAPPFSLTLNTWCFPVAGCVGYRGYFDESQAKAESLRLQAQGLEVAVYGVPAYSTLGWMNWAGGDPLLDTFIRYPEGELARMLFHELAHQVLYVQDDTPFNESFATAVERLATDQWLAAQGSDAARQEYARLQARRLQFLALVQATRQGLATLYASHSASRAVNPELLANKAQLLENFRSGYADLKAQWGGYAGYDPWVARANNASFGASAAYSDLVPGFEALFQSEGRNWPRFYDAVKRLARLSKAERRQSLKTMTFAEAPGG
jgi:predicted aminopeptidase